MSDDSVSDLAHNDYYSEDNTSRSSAKHANIVPSFMRSVKRHINGKNTKIIFFETNSTPNSIIRHAITGARCDPYRVGTANEDLFFSVILATGELGKNISILFYDNPEQYEMHFHIKLDNESKDLWRKKRDDALDALRRKKPSVAK